LSRLDDIKNKSDAKAKVVKQIKIEINKIETKGEYVSSIEKSDVSLSHILGFINYSEKDTKHKDMHFMHLLLGCVAFDLIINNHVEGIDYDASKEKHSIVIDIKTQSNYFILDSNQYSNVIYLALFSHYSKLTHETTLASMSNLFIELESNNKKILIIPDIVESVETFGYRFTDIVLTIANIGYGIDLDSFDEIHVIDINNIRYSVEIYNNVNSMNYVPIAAHSSSTDIDKSNNQVIINLQEHCIDCALYDICKDNRILKIK